MSGQGAVAEEQTNGRNAVAGERSSDPPFAPPDKVGASDLKPLTIHARAIVVLAFLAMCYTLYFAGAILFPVCLAVLLCLLLRPIVRRLEAWRVPTIVGAFVVVAALVAMVGTGIYFLAAPASEFVKQLPENIKEIERKFAGARGPLQDIEKASQQVKKLTESTAGPLTFQVQVQQPSLTNTLLNQTGQLLAGGAVITVLVFFLLASGNAFLRTTVEIMPTFRGKRDAVSMAQQIEYGVSRYLGTFALINVVLGIAIGTAMWLLGLPNPAMWGVMAGALNFIPYFGCAVGSFLVFVVAIVEFEAARAIWAPILYFSINSLEGQLITPAILGKSMRLNPVMILLSLIFWGWIWGVGGALLAVPLLATAKIVCDHFDRLAPVGKYLGAGG